MRARSQIGVSLLVAVHLLLGAWSAEHHSATFDEPMHVAAGAALWRTGDPRLDGNNPPLAKLLVAAPLMFRDLEFPWETREWKGAFHYAFGERFLYFSGNDADSILFAARMVNVGLSCFLALALWAWTRRRWGEGAALLTLTFYCLSPTLLAHASLATNDFPAVFFSLLALIAFDLSLEENARRAFAPAAAGAALAAFLCKYSAVLVMGAVGLLLLWEWGLVRRWPPPREGLLFFGLWILGAGIFLSAYPGAWSGFSTRLWQVGAGKHPSFLLGAFSDHGWPWYYGVAFLVKSSLAELAVFAGGGVLAVRQGRRSEPGLRLVFAALLLYLAAASVSRKQIGIRYVLIVYPLIACLAAPVARRLAGYLRRGAWAAALLGLAQCFAAASAAPHFIAYFNPAAGGAANGHRILLDSNLDFGQELKPFARFWRASGRPEVVLSYFGTASAAYHGIPAQHLLSHSAVQMRRKNSARPRAEWLVVSATNLAGVYGSPEDFSWLRDREPKAVLGHGLFVFDITGDAEAHRRLAAMYLKAGDRSLWERERLLAAALSRGAP